MKTISSVPTVEVAEDGTHRFAFQFDDGSKDVFLCGESNLTDFLSAISAASLRRTPKPAANTVPTWAVDYEAGNGRVMLSLGTGE